MFVIILLCLLFVGAALFFLWMAWEACKSWFEILTRKKVPCSALTVEALPERVKLTGEAAPGPDGLLSAPLSGTPCVWWRIDTREDDRGGKAADGEKRPVIEASHESSRTPFTLKDATGSVAIPIEDGRIRGVKESAHRHSPHPDHPRVILLQREHLVLPGTILAVSGAPSRTSDGSPALAPTRLTVTTPAAHPSPWPLFRLLLLFLGAAALCLAVPAYIAFDLA